MAFRAGDAPFALTAAAGQLAVGLTGRAVLLPAIGCIDPAAAATFFTNHMAFAAAFAAICIGLAAAIVAIDFAAMMARATRVVDDIDFIKIRHADGLVLCAYAKIGALVDCFPDAAGRVFIVQDCLRQVGKRLL